eukprot:2478199-Prymnesium_polylepis.2
MLYLSNAGARLRSAPIHLRCQPLAPAPGRPAPPAVICAAVNITCDPRRKSLPVAAPTCRVS